MHTRVTQSEAYQGNALFDIVWPDLQPINDMLQICVLTRHKISPSVHVLRILANTPCICHNQGTVVSGGDFDSGHTIISFELLSVLFCFWSCTAEFQTTPTSVSEKKLARLDRREYEPGCSL